MGAACCVPACSARCPVRAAHPSGTLTPHLQYSNRAAAPDHSLNCQGREKEAIPWGSSAILTFKSPYGVAGIKAGTPSGGQELCRKWRSVLRTEDMLLCNRFEAAEEKSTCLILKCLHMFNFHESQVKLPTRWRVAPNVCRRWFPLECAVSCWAGTQRHCILQEGGSPFCIKVTSSLH